MKLFQQKAFKIFIVIFGALVIVSVIIAGIGFQKNNKFIFQLSGFENLVSSLEKSKVVTIFCIAHYLGSLYVPDFNSNDENRNMWIKALESKDENSSSDYIPKPGIFRNKNIHLDYLKCVLKDYGFFAKIGFWFKRNHPVKTILEIIDFLQSQLMKHQISGSVLHIIDEKTIKIYNVSFSCCTVGIGLGSSKSFEFGSTKDFSNRTFEYIAFIVMNLTSRTFDSPIQE
ncbi:hypothetical protein CWI39_0712p0010 [Hamiltosporidium magnivora]|uniref:Uncharacterized protein n=1 Tax=Hamiltosporidium magnivora TaxID=148818 RepID=A0A4Q9LBP9_9MICR|nr:hypothetical protein CWI39_0712p0010 [Hamiltosporidium magnivora]